MEVLKKRQRFTDHDDLVLLREMLSHNPFETPALWQVIQENVVSLTGKTFTIRTLREHLDRLIKLWLQMFRILKDKSGIEVMYTEKDILCNNIYDLMKEFKDVKKKKTSITTSKCIGINARHDWTQLLEQSTEDTSIEANIFHDHGGQTTPLEEINNEITIDFVHKDDSNIQQNMPTDNEYTENTDPKMNKYCTSAQLLTPNKIINVSHHTKKQVSASESPTPSANPAHILGPVRGRKRKSNSQRQGLAYLEEYDKQQADLRKKQMELEERKIVIGERMLVLQEKQHVLEEFQIKKHFEVIEKKNIVELKNQENLLAMFERQDKLINLLISNLK